jgi:hypothetical protein
MPLVSLSASTVVRLTNHSRISVCGCILIRWIQVGVQNTVCALGTLWESSGTSLTGGTTSTISTAAGAALVLASSRLSLLMY